MSWLSAAWQRNKHIIKPVAIGAAVLATGGLAGGVIAGAAKIASGALGKDTGARVETVLRDGLDNVRTEAAQTIAGAGIAGSLAAAGRVAPPGSAISITGELAQNVALDKPILFGLKLNALLGIGGALIVLILVFVMTRRSD